MKQGRNLNSYRGRLTPTEISAGINAAVANAQRLADDADLLFKAGRFPTSLSLACLSIEESGKVSILRSLAIATSDEEVKAAWKKYRTHTRKNVQWLLPQLAMQGARKLDDLRPLFEEGADHSYELDNLKQLGFYTDCLDIRHWSTPIEAIDEQLACKLVSTAKLLVSKKEVSALEVELWKTHIGSVPQDNFALMQNALVNWYTAMQEAGLKPHGVNEMERFILEGVQFPKPK